MSDTSGTPQPGPDNAGGPTDPYAVPTPPPAPPAGAPEPPAAPTYGTAPTTPEAPAYGAPAAPAAPGYGSAPAYAAASPYAAPTGPGTDGVSIAALVTGILGLAIVPLILGILGLNRTKKNGTSGRGFAIAGIVLGALQIVAYIILIVTVVAGLSAVNSESQGLRDDCSAGDMTACDTLAITSSLTGEVDEVADTCGGTMPAGSGGSCQFGPADPGTDEGTTEGSAFTYGDDAALDALWDACEGGDMASCDDLYMESEPGSEYESFGGSCGNRQETDAYCVDLDL